MPESALVVQTPEEAAAQDRAPLLVLGPLEELLDAAGIGSGPIDARMIGDGHSNITYLLSRTGADVVLRRPPRPPLPPSAHDVVREARLLQGLESQDVRTPKVLLLHEDDALLGVPFYVMEQVHGDVIGEELPARFDAPAARDALVDELVDGLVELHAVDWRAAGLEWFGKGDNAYLERQLRRFSGLWDHNRTRELAEVDELLAWLTAHRPEQAESTLVHGDYRMGNVMYGAGPADAPPHLAAIFDWELATIGDPLADVGYLTANYAAAGIDSGPLAAMSSVTAEPGFPSRQDIVDRYAERSGRDVGDVRWHQTLAGWKACVFLEGSYKRHLAGAGDDPFFAGLGEKIPEIARYSLAIAHGEDA
ncbi:phosphotransferase family protein [Patulibacter minatonensis]|uniref:phosphotransferase family protein n=1 Tax=Patulibacter minatonensis TaxID=298163 RepID=UPI00047D0B26|nr:phosphotransferase family protein [Patulibacter minatonensis]